MRKMIQVGSKEEIELLLGSVRLARAAAQEEVPLTGPHGQVHRHLSFELAWDLRLSNGWARPFAGRGENAAAQWRLGR